jgi:hypothetical protein
MRSQPAVKPVAQRVFWGSVVAAGICLGLGGCHSEQPAQSPSNDTSDETASPKWSGGSSKPADTAAPESMKGKFDQEQANVVMARAAKNAHTCVGVAPKDDPRGDAQVTVIFSGIGRSTKATVSGEFQGKTIGDCVERAFVGIIIPPFDGADMEMQYPVDLKPDPKVPHTSDQIDKKPAKGK